MPEKGAHILASVDAGNSNEKNYKKSSDLNWAEGNFKYTDGMSDKNFTKLVKSIRETGLKNKVIQYVEVDGKHYIAIGNNRMMAAQKLGIVDQLEFEKVEFPVPNTNWETAQDIRDVSGTVKMPRVR